MRKFATEFAFSLIKIVWVTVVLSPANLGIGINKWLDLLVGFYKWSPACFSDSSTFFKKIYDIDILITS